MTEFADPRFVSKLAWSAWRRSVLGGFVGSIAVIVVGVLALPVFFINTTVGELALFFVTIWPGIFACGALIGIVATQAVARSRLRWVSEQRAPTPHEVARIARVPRFAAVMIFIIWPILAIITLVIASARFGLRWPSNLVAVLPVVIVFGSLVSAVITFLLVEQGVRPIVARVLPPDVDAWPRTLGMTRRLLLAWFLVSAIPMAVIALFIGLMNESQRGVAGTSLVIACVIIIGLGFLVFGVVGTSITRPLERIRTELRHVAVGRLDAEVPPTDAGEIGLMQVGFNQMMDGLRERERLRDVFGRHVGTDVARLAMETDFGSGGQACEATAMFVDIIGSTGLAQRKDPDAVVEILNRFFDAVVRVVGAEGGFVNKFHGDGALCIFGAPVPQDDHAARGLRAARALAEELAPLGDIAAAIGLSSGPMVAGNVGAIDRYEFTVVGDPVNEASRLSDEAKLRRSHVLVGERTIHAAGDAATGWIRGEAIALRGRSQPTITYSPYD